MSLIKGLREPLPPPPFLQLDTKSGNKSGSLRLFNRMSAGWSALSSSSSNSYS